MKVTFELDDPMPMTIAPILLYAKLLNLEVEDYDAHEIAAVITHLQTALEMASFYLGDERDAPLREATLLLEKIVARLDPEEEGIA